MRLLSGDELEAIIKVAVTRLTAALAPMKIYLYGSYAYGTPSPSSDIDLLVVVADCSATPFERDAIAYRALGDIPHAIDVQVYTKSEFESRAQLAVSFERTVERKGRQLHAA